MNFRSTNRYQEQRWATPTPELTLFYSELELEWSFGKTDGIGVELELKFLIRYGVGAELEWLTPGVAHL